MNQHHLRKLAFASVVLPILLVAMFSMVVAPQAALAEEPLTLEELIAIRKKSKRPSQVVKIAEKQGVDFFVDPAAEKSLRNLGFRKSHLEKLREISKQTAEKLKSERVPEAGEALFDDDIAGGKSKSRPKLDPDTEATVATLDGRIQRILAQSGVESKVHESNHARLITSDKLAKKLMPSLQLLEKELAKTFPKPIASGTDPRGVNIAIFDTRYEYGRWVRTLFKVYKDDGFRFNTPNAGEQAAQRNAFFIKGIYCACIEDVSLEDVKHRVVFASAYLSMSQLMRYQGPDCLTVGFGNLAESMLLGDPIMTVQSGYEPRKLDASHDTWAATVRKHFKSKKLGSVQNVLAYTTQSMKRHQYAEAWSLTSLLADQPKKFGELVERLAQGKSTIRSIREIYNVDDDELLSRWKKFARSKR